MVGQLEQAPHATSLWVAALGPGWGRTTKVPHTRHPHPGLILILSWSYPDIFLALSHSPLLPPRWAGLEHGAGQGPGSLHGQAAPRQGLLLLLLPQVGILILLLLLHLLLLQLLPHVKILCLLILLHLLLLLPPPPPNPHTLFSSKDPPPSIPPFLPFLFSSTPQ